MLPLGTPAPDFSLPDVVSGRLFSLDSFRDKEVLVVMFICHHCPYVKHVKTELARLGEDYGTSRVGLIAISSNDPAVAAEDSPDGLRQMVRDWGLKYPVCYDESQAIARAYAAACTPDFYVFDRNRRLAYRGQLDDSRPGNGKPVTGTDLRAAIDALLAGNTVKADQYPSLGCNIKWRQAA